MTAWRVSLTVGLLVVAASTSRAQTGTLAETLQPGNCFRYGIEMKLTGEMRYVDENAKSVPVKMSAQGKHAFAERVLAAAGGLVQKSARVYESATATIERGSNRTENTLRPSRKLIVAQRHKDQHLVYSPAGVLSHGELEVVSEHFDTLALTGLLPGKGVKVGETWKVPSPVAAALCSMEGMTDNFLTGKLTAVTAKEAAFSISGNAVGIWQGAQFKTHVEATCTFDLVSKRITKLVWKQKDQRDQGPVSPASTLEMTVTLTRQAIEQVAGLADVALVSVPEGFNPPGPMTNLEHRDPKGRYALVHTRDWVLTASSADHAVLRLMDREWIAQVTVTPWTKAKKGEHLSAEQFKTAMHETMGWRPERELQSGEVPAQGGKWIYRLSVLGQLNGVNVLQNFYLVAAPTGEQVVLAFTLSPKMADKLGARDLSLAGSLEVPAPAK
jgi:hypothetical protein